MRVDGAISRCVRVVVVTAIGAIAAIAVLPSTGSVAAMSIVDTYLDQFDAQSYTNNNGTLNFTEGWLESNDDGSATGGTIQIDSNELRFMDAKGDSISRLVDLGGVGKSKEVVLSFNWVAEGESGESLAVDLRNTANNWVQVATVLSSNGDERLPATIAVQLAPAQISARSGVRFRSTGTDVVSSSIIIDDVELAVGDIEANPDLAPSCGIDVMLVLDESGSINNAGATTQVEGAVNAFGAGLSGTRSRLRIAEFSTNGRLASIGGDTSYRSVNGNPDPSINSYLTAGGNAKLATNYNPGSGEQYSNWEAGLSVAATNLGMGKLVVFVTDGQPNTVGATGESTDDNAPDEAASSAGAAIDELESIKQKGAHVVVVGVGDATDDVNFDLLTRTVEPNNAQVWEQADGGFPDLRTVDSIRVSSFGALENALRRVVFALCSPSVSITAIDEFGSPMPNWTFTGSIDVAPVCRGTDQYYWISPALGLTVDDGRDNDAPRTRSTGPTGQPVLFQWVPNTVNDPQAWTSRFTYRETLLSARTLSGKQTPCAAQRLNSDGTISDLEISPVTSQLGVQAIFALPVQKGDIITCTVRHNRAAVSDAESVSSGPSWHWAAAAILLSGVGLLLLGWRRLRTR